VRWSRVAYAAGGTNYHTWLPSGYRGRVRDSNHYSRRLRSVLSIPYVIALVLNAYAHAPLPSSYTSYVVRTVNACSD